MVGRVGGAAGGDADSPASRQLTTGGSRQYRGEAPPAVREKWEDLDLDAAMDMTADRGDRGPRGMN